MDFENIVKKMAGPRGVHAVLEGMRGRVKTLENEERASRHRIDNEMARLQQTSGRLAEARVMLQTIYTMIQDCGLEEVLVHAESLGVKTPGDIPVTEEIVSEDPEVKAQKKKGLCLYKSGLGKWCRRKLKTKKEKKDGYCALHWDSLNSGKDSN